MNVSFHLGALALLVGTSGAARTTPAHDYADAVARIEQRQASDDSVVADGGRSIFMGPLRSVR